MGAMTGKIFPILVLSFWVFGTVAAVHAAAGPANASPFLPTPLSATEPDGSPKGDKDGPDENATKNRNIDRAYGAFQRGYYLTALDLALSRAKLGDPAAQTLVAEIYSDGLGVPRNMEKAAFWYKAAANGGDSAAQLKYALMLLEGRYVDPDRDKARELMKAAADSGNPSAEFNYGQMLISDQPGSEGLKKALPYMHSSAEAGIADAQFALAQIYAYGVGSTEPDLDEARKWMIRAARAGFDTAQLDIAVWLIDGVGAKPDYDSGFGWMRRAANGGNIMAQNRIAYLYINAIGTRPDPIEAAKWYILSRRAGMEDAALDDFFQGLTEEEQKAGIEAANNFHSR